MIYFLAKVLLTFDTELLAAVLCFAFNSGFAIFSL